MNVLKFVRMYVNASVIIFLISSIEDINITVVICLLKFDELDTNVVRSVFVFDAFITSVVINGLYVGILFDTFKLYMSFLIYNVKKTYVQLLIIISIFNK